MALNTKAPSYKGPTGPTGAMGAKGNIGPTGPKGETGEKGPQGAQGEIGPVGNAGTKGLIGNVGPTGKQGDLGTIGPKGNKGEVGDVGIEKGLRGNTGLTGPKGEVGDIGPVGSVGTTGAKGNIGDIGKPGNKIFGEKDYTMLTFTTPQEFARPYTFHPMHMTLVEGNAFSVSSDMITTMANGTYFINFSVYPFEVNAEGVIGISGSKGEISGWSCVQILPGEYSLGFNYVLKIDAGYRFKFFLKTGNGSIVFKQKEVNTPFATVTLVKIK